MDEVGSREALFHGGGHFMNLSRFFFVLKEGFLQLFRTRGLSTAVILIVASTLLQLSLFLGISKALDQALGSAREKFQMAVFLTPSSDDSDRKRIQELLLSDSRVASVRLVTKEEAVQDFRKDPEIDQMLQALGENPLTDSFTVILRNDPSEKLEDMVEKLKQDPRIEEVDYGKNEWETVSNSDPDGSVGRAHPGRNHFFISTFHCFQYPNLGPLGPSGGFHTHGPYGSPHLDEDRALYMGGNFPGIFGRSDRRCLFRGCPALGGNGPSKIRGF